MTLLATAAFLFGYWRHKPELRTDDVIEVAAFHDFIAPALPTDAHALPVRKPGRTRDASGRTVGESLDNTTLTEAADKFAASMTRTYTQPAGSPIFDVLTQEWPALYARRLRALTWDTQEIDIQFKGLTSLLAVDWMCTGCEAGDHQDCPACSCCCSLELVAVA